MVRGIGREESARLTSSRGHKWLEAEKCALEESIRSTESRFGTDQETGLALTRTYTHRYVTGGVTMTRLSGSL